MEIGDIIKEKAQGKDTRDGFAEMLYNAHTEISAGGDASEFCARFKDAGFKVQPAGSNAATKRKTISKWSTDLLKTVKTPSKVKQLAKALAAMVGVLLNKATAGMVTLRGKPLGTGSQQARWQTLNVSSFAEFEKKYDATQKGGWWDGKGRIALLYVEPTDLPDDDESPFLHTGSTRLRGDGKVRWKKDGSWQDVPHDAEPLGAGKEWKYGGQTRTNGCFKQRGNNFAQLYSAPKSRVSLCAPAHVFHPVLTTKNLPSGSSIRDANATAERPHPAGTLAAARRASRAPHERAQRVLEGQVERSDGEEQNHAPVESPKKRDAGRHDV